MNGPRRGLALAVLVVQTMASGCTIARWDKRSAYTFDHPPAITDDAFVRSLDAFGNTVVGGNRAELLNNGDEYFPAMLGAIRGAKRTVDLESFIFSDDRAGGMFAEALIDAAKRGVEVRVLLDATGGHAGALFGRMQSAGVKASIYHPIRPWSLYKVGRRTHRKILVVDGEVAFTGGMGIDDRWLGDARNPKEWHDMQVEVAGPAAAQMQAIFSEDWTYTTGEVLIGDKFYPPLGPAGSVRAQAIKASRGDASSLAELLYLTGIESATRTIAIQNAYFLPDNHVRDALVRAVKRGVDVQVMVPGRIIDVPLVRMASRLHYGELLQGGVKIYEYQGTMIHSKTAVVDGLWTIIGSINFDDRSLRENAEDCMTFYDRDVAARLEATFEADRKRCREITYEHWKRRGFEQRVAELFSWIWQPLY